MNSLRRVALHPVKPWPEAVTGMLAAIFIAVAEIGCGARQATTYPVHGKLLINGEPAKKALVYFAPAVPIDGGNPRPFGVVAPDGSYRPSTFTSQDGLPAGEYAVTVVWPQLVLFDGVETPEGDRLHGKYANASHPATRVTITPETRELPLIELRGSAVPANAAP